jgi:hypothetical protein
MTEDRLSVRSTLSLCIVVRLSRAQKDGTFAMDMSRLTWTNPSPLCRRMETDIQTFRVFKSAERKTFERR